MNRRELESREEEEEEEKSVEERMYMWQSPPRTKEKEDESGEKRLQYTRGGKRIRRRSLMNTT